MHTYIAMVAVVAAKRDLCLQIALQRYRQLLSQRIADEMDMKILQWVVSIIYIYCMYANVNACVNIMLKLENAI